MVNYQNGKIYEVVNSINNKCYIGSTTQRLCVRMAGHRSNYKSCKSSYSSKILFEEDYDNCKIILIENYPCDNKEQLHKRERHWVEQIDCLNKNIPSRTKDEIIQYQKEYRENHKQNQKEYKIQNKQKIKEYKAQKYICQCGSITTINNKTQHIRTKKHQQFVNQ